MTVDEDGPHDARAATGSIEFPAAAGRQAGRHGRRGRRRARAGHARRRAAPDQRRAARRVPQRRRRLDDHRRRDEPADEGAGQDVQHRLRGRCRRTTRPRIARLAAERFKTDHTEFRCAPSAIDLHRHADLASRRPVRRFVGDADLHRVEADARARDGRADRRRRRRGVCRLPALLRGARCPSGFRDSCGAAAGAVLGSVPAPAARSPLAGARPAIRAPARPSARRADHQLELDLLRRSVRVVAARLRRRGSHRSSACCACPTSVR